MNAEQRRAARPRVPLTELRSQAAAEELVDRLRDATRAVTNLGGWPPSDSFQHVVAGWLAEFGLTIDDDGPALAADDG